MGFAGASSPTSTALRCWAIKSRRQVVDECLVDRRALELEVVEVLGKRQLGDGELYLIERACFSLISALSRSPTMR